MRLRDHDPLCFADDDPYNCDCDLIAQVRADERGQAADRMKGFIFRNLRLICALTVANIHQAVQADAK